MKNNKNLQKQTKKKNALRLDPALRAALILLIPSILFRMVTVYLGYSLFGTLLQLVVYVLCGYMAATGYYESIRKVYPRGRPVESVRSGAKSGITLGILLSILLILLMLIISWLAPIGLFGLSGGVTLVFLVPVDILGGLFLGALGGKISATSWR